MQVSVLSDTSIDEALTTRDNDEVYIEVVLDPALTAPNASQFANAVERKP
ncbi:hypothetical protein AQB9606_04148 [Aquabacterium sp. CECT 9606]|nr:hypothetical protein AQB9606_04148 [Aquabacterium sp. CECT 9606]